MNKGLTNPTTGMIKSKTPLGKPKYKKDKNPLKGYKGMQNPMIR